MNSPVSLVLIISLAAVCTAYKADITCKRNWRKVGCFHDDITPNRPLPYELTNHRDQISKHWDGHLIKWTGFAASIHTLACRCAKLAKAKGYKYFGLQFYGECWSGPSHAFYRDGPSKQCIGHDYKACDKDAKTECVGRQSTNYIYMIDDSASAETKLPGGWSEWGPWSTCDAKCGGGKRSRARECTNPAPKNGGEDCGEYNIQHGGCNEEKCEPVCKKMLEVGVVLDGSTSVTRENWMKTIDFVKTFSDEFIVGPDNVHFGVIHYSRRAHLDFKISDARYWSQSSFKAKVTSIPYVYGGTRTDLALTKAEESFFCKDCGLRKHIPKLLLVLTDGNTSKASKSVAEVSKYMKEVLKVTVMAVGVGNKIDYEELNEIASNEEYVFALNNYNYLSDKINKMLKVSCNARSRE